MHPGQVHDRPITDAELVLLARAGEADALGALLERHRAPLYAAALAVLGDGAVDIYDHASSPCR